MNANHPENPFILHERVAPAPTEETWQPRNMRRWLQALPKANPAVAARQLCDRLDQLNRVEIPVTDRIHILNDLLDPIQVVLRSLVASCALEVAPLHRRTQACADLVADLSARAATAYKVLLQQTREGSLVARLWHKQARAQALHRMLYFIGQMMLSRFRLYRPCPQYLWQEVYRIYRYAEDSGLHNRPVPAEEPVLRKKSTVADLFKQLLLLSLAGPSRLLQGEADKVFIASQRLAPLARLQKYRALRSHKGLFLANRTDAQPPGYLARAVGNRTKGWVLDTRPMAELLAKQLQETTGQAEQIGPLRPKEQPGVLPAGLIRRLMMAWGMETERSADRALASGPAHIACGLDAIHSLLGGFPVGSGRPADDGLGDTPWADSASGRVVESIALDEHPGRASWRANATLLKEVETHSCRICDKSPGGYQLRWQGRLGVNLRVGELIGVTEHIELPTPESWRVGVIRWLRSDSSGAMEFGLQILDEEIKPVSLQHARQGGSRIEHLNGLLLSPGDPERETLITLPFFVTTDDVITLIDDAQLFPIKLAQSLEVTGAFARFRFGAQESEQSPTAQSGDPAPDCDDAAEDDVFFNDLWRSL